MTRLLCWRWMLAGIGALAMGCSDDGLGVGGVGDAGSSGGSAGEMTATMSASAGMSTAGGMSASASGGDTTAATTDDDGLDDTAGPGSTSGGADGSTGGADGSTGGGGSTTDGGGSTDDGGGSTDDGGSTTDGGGSSSDDGSTDGGSTDGGSTSDAGESSSDDGGSSSDGGMPQVEGFGDCVNNPPDTVCLPDEQCITDLTVPPTQGVCTDPACVDAGDCPLAPPGGTAPVICTDVTGEGINECIIACAGGGTCPTGMFCALGLACAWAAD